MTPERKEEIATTRGKRDWYTLQRYIMELLDALEEAQQQNERLRKNFMFSGSALEAAQQTIARLTAALIAERDDALTWDGIGTVNRINEALGEGAKES
jgi:hypothetical protein